MIPISSAAGPSAGQSILVVLLALAPAGIAWWRDRRLLHAGDDPALPELLAARRREQLRAVAVAAAVMIVLGGRHAAWGIPLLLVLLIAAAYPVRTRLLGETWGFGAYLWHTALSFTGGFGFWIALAYAPIAVAAIVRAVGVERWWIALAVVPVLLAWEEWYPRIWLWSHAAEPLARADLLPRFEEIVRRAGTARPRVYRVGPKGSRFVNAVALPSVRRPAVAMGDALLELLAPDECVAIFAHEVAHFDHFTPRHIRRGQVANRVLIVAGVALPLIAIFGVPAARAWIGWLWPVAMLLALARRASKRQQHETECDLRAAALCGDPEALVRALVKLHLHARVPRRWAMDFERVASHPSLVRRIQAIRGGGAAAVEQLDGATVVRSPREGSWVVLDQARGYWLDGVAADTEPALAALREAASSYRAVNYEDLVELRVAASGDARTLHARARAGDAWSVPLAPADVARVQRALDVVDVRLGRARRASDPMIPRLIATLAIAAAVISGQAGVVLVPAGLVLWKPGPASLAALGAMSIMRAALGAVAGSYLWSEATFGAALLALAGTGVAAMYVAARQVKAGELDAHVRLTTGALAAVATLAAATVLWLIVSAARMPLVGAPLVGTLATTLIGIAAALFTVRRPAVRRVAYGSLAAAALVGVLAVDREAFSLRDALRETTARATMVSETDLGGAAHGLRVSPNGTSFLATRFPAGRRGSARAGVTITAGRLGGPVRDVAGIGAEFVDDERLLVLDVLDGGDVELRLERLDGAAAPLWADTLADFNPAEPQLIIDGDARSWTIVDGDADADGTVLVTGRIGERGGTRRVVIPDTVVVMGAPIVFGPATTVIVPASAAARRASAPSLWAVPLSGMDFLRTELWRVRGDSLRRVASLRGPPQCGEPVRGMAACVVRHLNSVSLYAVSGEGDATEIARRGARDLGVVTVGPGLRATSMTFERAILVMDLATRRLTRIAMPPNGEYASEARSGPAYVVTLGYAETGRSMVRRYRVE